MPSVLAVLFWVWLLVSVVILVRRRAGRAGAGAQGAPDPEGAEVTDEESSALVPATVGPVDVSAPDPAPAPGFDLPVAPILERPAPRSAPAAGIADALVGIRMPCDLVPLVLDRLANDRVTLSTTGHPAEEVGPALADEVERLGYVVRPLSDREVIATRGATELRLTITPPQADGRHFDHPSAREDSVVVEISLS